MDDHRTHRWALFVRLRLTWFFLKKRQDFLPAVHRLLLPVCPPIIIEKAMTGAVIAVKLIVLAMLLGSASCWFTCSGVGDLSSLPKRPIIGQERSLVKINRSAAVGVVLVS